MSYFDVYVTVKGKRTMSGYSDCVWLERFEDRGPGKEGWEFAMENMQDLDDYLTYTVPHFTIVTREQREKLDLASEAFIRASTLDTDMHHIHPSMRPKAEDQEPDNNNNE